MTFVFQSILSSNVPPSCDEANSLRQLLRQEESTLTALLENITQLQTHLNALFEQHRNSQAKIQQYRAALSSVRVLPPELVRRIFIYCVEDPPITWPPNPDCPPLSLTQICSGWREVALDTPELWRNINFRADSLIGVEKFKELAELWLSRCRVTPASLAFTPKCYLEMISNPVGDVIAQNSSSIGNLELHLPTVLFKAFSDYPPEAFPQLRTLLFHGTPIVSSEHRGYRLWDADYSPFQFAPRLTDVVISIPKSRINLEGLSLPWSQLSSLHLAESLISPNAMLRILDRCCNLTSCSVRLVADDEITTLSGNEITMSSLTSFSLHSEAEELDEFLRYITLPVIHTLALHVRPYNTWYPESLMRLVFRSRCQLKSLTIATRTMETDDFIDLLHVIPTIQELNMMFVYFMTDDVLRQMSPMTVYEDPIVPCLRVLECKEMSLGCSPDAVRRFIATRGWPVAEWAGLVAEGENPQRHEVQHLEKVVIRSRVGHFGSEWTEKLLEFQDRGLDLTFGLH